MVNVRRSRKRKGGWEVDIRILLPNGSMVRERREAPVASKSAAWRWASERERALRDGPPQPKRQRKEVPRLRDFAQRFLDDYARANRQKPSGIAAKETILRVHLVPLLGDKRLDRITNEDIARLKSNLQDKKPKTVNNVLSVLSKLLKVAVEWEILGHVPCTIKLLRTDQPEAEFHDFDLYERLVQSAARIDQQTRLLVLLGGEAGLRCGEMMALEWTDIDLPKRQLWVRRSDWKGHVTTPKGGRPRCVPLTRRLTAALREHRHLRGHRVLCQENSQPLTQKIVRGLVARAARKALLVNCGVHTLRHTFCSHLAMRGAPTRAIQELAGHKDLSTSQRYMHLSPAAIESAIRLLDEPSPTPVFGAYMERAKTDSGNLSP